MAEHWTLDELKLQPIVAYATLRPSLRSGDLFFCSGNYQVSELIERVTSSPWSHVGVILISHDINRVLLLESVEDVGVRLAPVSKYLSDYENGEPYKGPLVFARRTGVDEAAAVKMARFGVDQLTKPYDNGEIAEIVARIALGVARRETDGGYICSELVAACYLAAGLNIPSGAGGFTTPEDVWLDPDVTPLGRVQ